MSPLRFVPVAATALCFLQACKKDVSTIGETPEIEFVSVAPSTVAEYKDSIVFSISYRDGDGDLGENSPDVHNVFVTDSRNGVTYKLRIPQLAPDGAAIAIKGTLSLVLKNTAITNGAASQSVTWSIYVTDRAGHMSNTVTSAAVTVVK